MTSNWTTRTGRTNKRGLFANGIWHCDCETRLPAEKFQVKNGGKNHGRWFYTCQKSQPKRCPFFLWSDDAKIREEAAVLNNSKSEPDVHGERSADGSNRLEGTWKPEETALEPKTPRTPMRQRKITEPITPVSNMKRLQKTPSPPPSGRSQTLSPASAENKHDDSFDWSSSADEELAEIADTLEAQDSDESPRKAAKISKNDSPSKRNQSDMLGGTGLRPSMITDTGSAWPLGSAKYPVTPSTSRKHPNGIVSPGTTPARHIATPLLSESYTKTGAPASIQADEPQEDPSALALEALNILSPVRQSLGPMTEQGLISLLNRHDLRTQGILKGREIARVALQNKEKKITELQQRIASLEAERDTSRTVIQHLKSDIASSPKKPRRPRDGGGPGGGGFKRSEI